MPPALIAATVVTGVLGTVASFIGSKKASKAAKEEAAEQARLEGLVTGEKLRRLDIDERTLYGETVAGYAGGGVQAIAPSLDQTSLRTGSPQSVLQEQAKSFRDERKITKEVGASKAQAALTRGKNLADQYRYQGYANVASSIGNILSGYGQMKYGR